MSSEIGAPLATVGRIVHFYTLGSAGGEYPSTATAAVVTGIHPANAADLFVMYPNGTSHKRMVPWSDEPLPGHWTWPPRVPVVEHVEHRRWGQAPDNPYAPPPPPPPAPGQGAR